LRISDLTTGISIPHSAIRIPQFNYFSLCPVCLRHFGQYLFNSILVFCLFLFLVVPYVLSLQTVHSKVTVSLMMTPDYSMISLMAPAPTVLPPSRMAKRWPFSRATG